ncbi:Fpg/Nei family DNA glycosylase [Rhodococcus triatomae]|uniref:DNA-(apurinic or apyrimidinic site) lyase n=1 Tax=Rhodococcus triatomae TaxID=300028 RepID=A0A1G8FGT3_9NOCA|nr:DNA-formamidopyrimidine glycosylase family protein [Rhodococcus triatomae]QNG19477.1 Fpg/Nei family DNA glycosylase [Rhodococcus triatomae]QNG24608.1 Fpg/Nei family DNA glycosylase [Rhodococcus triatomae]SDH81209.1 endonuclease-8 [Rhodococcus triatomae]
MPEGDTVWRTAKSLRAVLSGRVLRRTDFRVPRFATTDLAGQEVDEVLSRGKHLLIRVGTSTIHTHLKMEGVWHVYRLGERWRRPGHQARLVLDTDAHTAVGFSLGVTEILGRDREDDVVGHLGPDLLGADWDAAVAAANLRAAGDQPIGLSLLDQRNLAGIGNIYRNEVCFLRGVDPFTPSAQVPDLRGLVTLAQRILFADRDRPVRHRPWVYGRAGQRCRRCGAPLEARDLGGRNVISCPRCQPAFRT